MLIQITDFEAIISDTYSVIVQVDFTPPSGARTVIEECNLKAAVLASIVYDLLKSGFRF